MPNRTSIFILSVALVASAGCKDEPPIPQAESINASPVAATPRSPATSPAAMPAGHPGGTMPAGHPGGAMPAGHPSGMMPAGHPPVAPASPAAAAPATAAHTGPLMVEGLVITPAEGWVAETPNNRMRLRQYALPRVEGDPAEGVVTIVVAGGDVASNIARWRGQFKAQPDPMMAKLEVEGREITLVEIAGTFLWKASPMSPGPGEERPDYVVRGVIIPGEEGRHVFVKGWGPAKTMARWKASFETLASKVLPISAVGPE